MGILAYKEEYMQWKENRFSTKTSNDDNDSCKPSTSSVQTAYTEESNAKSEKRSSEIVQGSNSKHSTSERSRNIATGQPDDNMSIEEALDAIIQEEDLSNSTATLEIKETDDGIE